MAGPTVASPGRRRDELLRRALEPVAEDAGQIQEHLRGDAWIAPLDAAQESLVDRQHLNVAGRHHVGAALALAHETHLAEHVPPLEVPDPLTLAIAGPHLGRPPDDDEHLVAALAAADDG